MLFIFDKDGTICRPNDGGKFINKTEQQILMSGVALKCAALKAQGHHLAVASNQGGVAFGFMSPAEAEAIVAHAAQLIGAEEWQVSFCHPGGTVGQYAKESQYRKPNPKMLLDLMATFSISKANTVMIGDRPEDQEAAKAAGVDFQWADEFFNA